MKRWWLNGICLLIAVLSGVGMFVLKYQVIELEEKLAKIHRKIAFDKREIHMLQGDWASLNDPERLRMLVEQQTEFRAIGSHQIIEAQQVPLRLEKAENQEPIKDDKK